MDTFTDLEFELELVFSHFEDHGLVRLLRLVIHMWRIVEEDSRWSACEGTFAQEHGLMAG